MKPVESVAHRGWDARLDLSFRREGARSILAKRSSYGPLAIQKALYPEGDGVCHVILLHPPGGIAGGDRLGIHIAVERDSHALLTTPGATKWYRTIGPEAAQTVHIAIGAGATCEWMPQENIFFDATRARNVVEVELGAGAIFCGWDVMCLGRTASGERFGTGWVRQQWRIDSNGKPMFEELGTIEGGSAMLDSPAALAGYPVCGTFLLAGVKIDRAAIEFCRNVVPEADCQWGVTVMDDLLVARCLARSGEAARRYFMAMWDHLRPGYATVPAKAPRIWAT